jgi:hypothetical protein
MGRERSGCGLSRGGKEKRAGSLTKRVLSESMVVFGGVLRFCGRWYWEEEGINKPLASMKSGKPRRRTYGDRFLREESGELWDVLPGYQLDEPSACRSVLVVAFAGFSELTDVGGQDVVRLEDGADLVFGCIQWKVHYLGGEGEEEEGIEGVG